MDTKLVSENEKSFTIKANGKDIIIAKTPGAQKLLTALKAKGAVTTPVGKIPGKAKVPGDSPKNDTVTIQASPGEGIIPREAMQSPEAAMEFVKRLFANKEAGGMKMSKGGKVGDVEDPAYMFKGGKLCYYGGGAVVDPEEAKKAAESMRKAFRKYADGGIVEDDDEDDKEEGIDEPININGTYSEGGIVKKPEDEDDDDFITSTPSIPINGTNARPKQRFPFGGVVEEEEAPPGVGAPMPSAEMAPPMPMTPTPAAPIAAAPALAGPPVGVMPSQNQVLPNGPADPTAAAVMAGMPTQMKETVTNQTHGMLGGDKKEVKKTKEELAKEVAAGGNLVAKQLDKEAAEVRRYTQEVQQKNDEFETNRIFRQTQIENKMDEVDKTRQSYLSMKVDPKHLWGDEGTGNRLMAAAGIILGGFGQAFNGKDNNALQIVDNALKRDLEIQKANIAKAGDNLDTQRNMYKDFKDKLGDEAAAEKATLATMKERYANQLDLIAKTAGSEQTRNKATQAAAQIRADAAMEMGKVGGYINTTVNQEATPKPLENAPQGVQDKYLNMIQGSKQLRSIQAQYDQMNEDGSVTPFDVRVNRVLGIVGLDDPKYTTIDAKIMAGVANLLHAKSGTGASEKEFNRMKDQYPDLTKNPETFKLFLKNEVDKADSEIADMQNSYSGYQRLPNDTRGPSKSSLGMTRSGK